MSGSGTFLREREKKKKKVRIDSKFGGKSDMEICLLLIWSSTNYSQTQMLNEKEETLNLDKDQNKFSGLLNIFVCDMVLNCGFLLLLVEIPWKWLIMLRHLDIIVDSVMEMAMRMWSS